MIDVNTGRYVGKTDQDETILKTNLEAVKTIIEQIRLRNIGGLIVLDLIDMQNTEHRKQVFEALREALKKDKARSRLLPISELGLIEMTRKRSRESLTQILCTPCRSCEGTGLMKSTATTAYEILRRIRHEAVRNPSLVQIAVQVHPETAQYLQRHEERVLGLLEAQLDTKIVIKANSALSVTQYEILGIDAAA